MNKSEFIALYTQDQRIDVEYLDSRRDVTPTIVRHTDILGSGANTLLYSQLDKANVADAIQEQIAYFENYGQEFEWKVYDYDTPPDLKDRLAAFGFEIEEAEAIMVLDLAVAPEFLLQPIRPTVKKVTDPERLEDVFTIERQVWQTDQSHLEAYLPRFVTQHPEYMSIYVAYVDDRPASAAWIYFPPHSQFASLWGGSTLKEFRQRGLYTALLAVRLQEATQRQVNYLTVDASPMSRSILEKFGFEMIAMSYPCNWKASTNG
jgi:GNAT superfamily N-acetyltransferase